MKSSAPTNESLQLNLNSQQKDIIAKAAIIRRFLKINIPFVGTGSVNNSNIQ
jgi:uncharacterized protein (DUF1778 family)